MQSLTRAAELLGLVPVFPVRNIANFTSGSESGGVKAPVFKDCVLVKRYECTLWRIFAVESCSELMRLYRNSTVGDVFRKVMGDVPLAFVETVGGVRVSEDDAVAVGKNDVSLG